MNNIVNINKKKKKVVFHGGCAECTIQTKFGIEVCQGCMYFDCDWGLPDLNNEPPSEAEIIVAKAKAGIGKKRFKHKLRDAIYKVLS